MLANEPDHQNLLQGCSIRQKVVKSGGQALIESPISDER